MLSCPHFFSGDVGWFHVVVLFGNCMIEDDVTTKIRKGFVLTKNNIKLVTAVTVTVVTEFLR